MKLNDPDPHLFVKQIKQGTYRLHKKGENGDNLWLEMPVFSPVDIPVLLELASDTTHIRDYPLNPISSRRPFPEGRGYFILGECLLWTVEGIRNGARYGSLDPFLVRSETDTDGNYMALTTKEILAVRELYIEWWKNHKNGNWKGVNPLEDSGYIWF
ncbi:DUF4943 family protein [Proteiniphilum sp. X52]|uniref:DUF4943 family protein n=1 Tax=Proteiniphilum sp. X52 TaxID=2382159 RepID=UPI0013144CE8|nr:DUF4943 family protein [Proteiniphilum sp. X52]